MGSGKKGAINKSEIVKILSMYQHWQLGLIEK